MAEIIISSFITDNGLPATTLDPGFPLIRIWEVTNSTYTLIVGSPNGSGLSTDQTMTEVTDGTSEDGFYSFVFNTAIGYDPTKNYLVRVNAGPSVPNSERYQVATLDFESTGEGIADSVWEAASSNYTNTTEMGGRANAVFTNTGQLLLDVADVNTLVDLAVKYQTNRTKIDIASKSLIVYDNDSTTELRRFQLLDAVGNSNVIDVAERDPISATDGRPV